MRPRLMRAARRYLDPDAANEVAIAALHTIWTKNLPVPQDRNEELRTHALAFRILEGHVRNTLRARARRARLLEAVVEHHATTPHAETDGADWLAQQDSEDAVRELVDDLPSAERQVVLLVIDGFKVGEIATVLGIRPGAVSMRLNRARKRLRGALDRRDR